MKTLLVLAVLLAVTAAASEPPTFVVIVNAANAATLTRDEIANVFLKRITRWPGGGGPVAVVDAVPGSPVREDFSRTVLHRGTPAVEAYWQQQIFSGRDVPPVQKDSDAEIVAFVRKNRGGIGYVAAGTSLDGVRAVAWTWEQ
jgi:ABC-type phosphate transport system substrate-binding protein